MGVDSDYTKTFKTKIIIEPNGIRIYADFEEFGKLWKKQKAIHNNLVGSNQSYPSGGVN